MSDLQTHIDMLRGAELQFRLASTVHLATRTRRQPLEMPVAWSYGKHKVSYNEMALTPEGATFAARVLERTTTYLMAFQIQEALTWFSGGQARNHADTNISCAFEIARLIRNAFAHQPLHPKWSIDPKVKDRIFTIPNVIEIDTRMLQSKEVDWRDYGGPLAILRFSQHVRCTILGDNNEGMAREKEPPNVTYLQQGSLILQRL